MQAKKTLIYSLLFLCCSCNWNSKEAGDVILPAPSLLEKILEKGTLDISMFYNTTDYYVYRGITRGFHYDLAKDFADYLGVKLRITEVSCDIDTAINHLQTGAFDLLAASMTNIPERAEQLQFSQPLFETREVLVQNKRNPLLLNLHELDGKKVFIQKSALPYKKVLRQIEDSLKIDIDIIEVDLYAYEDILHLIETGEIDYSVTDENIAQASATSMKNIDHSLKLNDNIQVCWGTPSNDKLLTEEINNWIAQIRKDGKLSYLYKRYFNNHQSTPHYTSKYVLLKQGGISVFDKLLQKESKKLGWDWRLLAAIVYTESQFNPEAESEIGAYGLMQIIPETAGHYNVTDYFQPDSNVYVGVQFLKYLDTFFSNQPIDSTERIKFILASYNAGPGHVLDAMRLAKKYKKDPYVWDNNVAFYLINKNNPKYYRDPEAKNGYCNGEQAFNFVHKVTETYNNYKNISF